MRFKTSLASLSQTLKVYLSVVSYHNAENFSLSTKIMQSTYRTSMPLPYRILRQAKSMEWIEEIQKMYKNVRWSSDRFSSFRLDHFHTFLNFLPFPSLKRIG